MINPIYLHSIQLTEQEDKRGLLNEIIWRIKFGIFIWFFQSWTTLLMAWTIFYSWHCRWTRLVRLVFDRWSPDEFSKSPVSRHILVHGTWAFWKPVLRANTLQLSVHAKRNIFLLRHFHELYRQEGLRLKRKETTTIGLVSWARTSVRNHLRFVAKGCMRVLFEQISQFDLASVAHNTSVMSRWRVLPWFDKFMYCFYQKHESVK